MNRHVLRQAEVWSLQTTSILDLGCGILSTKRASFRAQALKGIVAAGNKPYRLYLKWQSGPVMVPAGPGAALLGLPGLT